MTVFTPQDGIIVDKRLLHRVQTFFDKIWSDKNIMDTVVSTRDAVNMSSMLHSMAVERTFKKLRHAG